MSRCSICTAADIDQHRPQRRTADVLDHFAAQDLDERERERRAIASTKPTAAQPSAASATGSTTSTRQPFHPAVGEGSL